MLKALKRKATYVAHRDNIHRLDQTHDSVSREIWALFQRAYRVEANIIGVDDFPPLNRTVENIRITTSVFTGLFENAALAAVSETQTDGNSLFIDGFVVEPKFFRQGIGSQLFQFVLDEFHCETAFVETAAENEPAVFFYKRFGFMEIDRWETADGMQLVRLGANLRFNQSMQSDQPMADL